MCEQIRAINQYYKILVYDKINKEEALNKLSTLHKNLKFKNNNKFSDRYFETVSVIEKNLSLFNSICNHVDIITTLLDHLHANGTKLMFDNEKYDTDDFNIIYLMLIICEEDEISTFLRKAIIDNSILANKFYELTLLISNYTAEMIVFEDSDLHAIITYLKIEPFFLLKIKKIFIQESVKQKFLWLLEKNFKHFLCVGLPIFIFHSRNELVTNCKDCSLRFNTVSIWSEDSISAKTLAMKLQNDFIFINTILEFGTGIKLPLQKTVFRSFHCFLYPINEYIPEDEDKINLNTYTCSVYNHFYNGTWQKPVSDTYWIHNDNIYAHATRIDINRATNSALEAFKSWSNLPLNSRKEILNNLAYTLEYNGKYLLAKTVSKCIKLLSKMYKHTLISDERLELITINAPGGVIPIYHIDEVALFSYLTISLYFGNCVLVVYSKNTCNIIPYFNMFSTAEVPPGVINLISHKNIPFSVQISNPPLPEQIMEVTIPKNIILPLK